MLLAAGESPEQVAEVTKRQGAVLDAVVSDAPDEEIRALIRGLIEAQMVMADATADMTVDDDTVDTAMAQLSSAWMRAFLDLDPAEHLAKVRCPVLALNGALDLQVPVDQNLPAIKQAVQSGGGDVTIHRLEGLNHLFQPATKGTLDEYPRIETTFDPAAMAIITNWIRTQVGLTQ